jgi:HSP90 family molecular chaperone
LEEETRDHRYAGVWTIRKVVKEKMGEAIDKAIKKKVPDAQPGSAEYIQHYQAAWRDVTNGLTEEQREEYEKLAQEWNKTGVTAEMKARYPVYSIHTDKQLLMNIYL